MFHQHLTNPETLSRVLSIAESTLFPNGHPAPAVPDPSIEEQLRLKTQAEMLLASKIPPTLVKLFCVEREELVKDVLDALADWECNVVLVLETMEVVVGRLFPEMTLQGK